MAKSPSRLAPRDPVDRSYGGGLDRKRILLELEQQGCVIAGDDETRAALLSSGAMADRRQISERPNGRIAESL